MVNSLAKLGETDKAKEYLIEARNFFSRNNMNNRLKEANDILDEIIDPEKSQKR